MEIIEDLIILGRAVPELRPRGGGTKGVCLAGYSPSRGFLRIDPCRVDLKVNRWDIIRIEVERRPQDAREESWRIVNAHREWDKANDHVKIVGRLNKPAERLAVLENNLSNCVQEVNDAHVSLCIIKPQKISHFAWFPNPRYGQPYQTVLFEDVNEHWVSTSAEYEFEPRIKYTCPECRTVAGHHDMKFIGWDAFEYLRKNPGNPGGFWTNARFLDSDYQHYFFVGNQRNRLTSYLIIGVIWIKSPNNVIAPHEEILDTKHESYTQLDLFNRSSD